MNKRATLLFDLALLLIISIPAFISLLNNQYFSMHDNQHIVRLYLLDQGIRQGNIFPRWVDGLGFGFGYPLFNFYPPLIYYIGEFFHVIGFSLIWSVKLVFILGFIVAAFGIYFLIRKKIGRLPAILGATLYTYFFYHAVNAYVRGALAEFFSMAILPYLFLAIENLVEKRNTRSIIFFGMAFAVLIIGHPLIAFPTVFYLGFFFLFHLLTLKKDKLLFVRQFIIGCVLGVMLASFFWLPSMAERRFTLVDSILTKELANYKIHYIFPGQFIYSPWGFGGSIAGPIDGMTFQLGKVQLGLFFAALIMSFIFLFKKIEKTKIQYFLFSAFLLFFSLFMTTQFSSLIWDKVKFLWYLQFPWRFLTFAGLFISICGSYVVFFVSSLLPKNNVVKILIKSAVICIIFATVFIYHKYFYPQRLLTTNDSELTTFREISWQISRSSFEFSPKGVKTKKTELGTTTIDIEEKDLSKEIYASRIEAIKTKVLKNTFSEKIFQVNVKAPTVFQLNTFNFPGWKAYLNGKRIAINDKNKYKLITVELPKGEHELEFIFEDTTVRRLANVISILTAGICLIVIKYKK